MGEAPFPVRLQAPLPHGVRNTVHSASSVESATPHTPAQLLEQVLQVLFLFRHVTSIWLALLPAVWEAGAMMPQGPSTTLL